MPITAEELVALGWDTMVPDTINGRSNGDNRITFNHPDDTYGPCAEALADAAGGAIVEIEAWSESVIILSQRGAFGATNPVSGMTQRQVKCWFATTALPTLPMRGQ